MITRLIDPTEGQVILDGQDITRLKGRQLQTEINIKLNCLISSSHQGSA